MNSDTLWSSILQAAIQGKLVPKNPHESNTLTIDAIVAEKKRLVSEGKIKDKGMTQIYKREGHWYELTGRSENCIDEEISFDVPSNWLIVRQGSVLGFVNGKSYDVNEVVPEDKGKYKLIRVGNLFTSNSWLYTATEHDESQYCYDGDLIYGWSMSIGPYIWKGDKAIYVQHIWKIIFGDYFDPEYLYYSLLEDSFELKLSKHGSTMQHVTLKMMEARLCYIPPLDEQKRIVAKLEELKPLVERYGRYQTRLSELNASITPLLKKSILQAAIQGRLVPQDPNDGLVETYFKSILDKRGTYYKTNRIKDKYSAVSVIRDGDEWIQKDGVNCLVLDVPFDIPDSWIWVKLTHLCSYVHRGKSPKYSDVKKYPVVAQKCNQWSGLDMSKCLFIDPDTIEKYDPVSYLQDGDILINSTGTGTCGRTGIYDSSLNAYELAVADSHVTVIRTFIDVNYLYCFFAGPDFQSKVESISNGSTNQIELATKTVENLLIPLPPLAEQQRIVARVKQLNSILDDLKGKIA